MTDRIEMGEVVVQGHSSLSVVIPAFNEESNIDHVYERLSKVLSGCRHKQVQPLLGSFGDRPERSGRLLPLSAAPDLEV
jgi:hypothetical protein